MKYLGEEQGDLEEAEVGRKGCKQITWKQNIAEMIINLSSDEENSSRKKVKLKEKICEKSGTSMVFFGEKGGENEEMKRP